jgi:hypothetical protein
VLIERERQEGIRRGEITVLFRRWRRRQASAGKVYRTPAGRIAVDAIDVVRPGDITADDAARAGYASVADVVADLRGDDGDPVHRLRIRAVDEPDPRDVLASSADLSPDALRDLERRLDRLDRSSPAGPWTTETLRVIELCPGVRAGDLAARLGRDAPAFKLDVRKLKNLGLTVSLPTGYELSPRGRAFLATR